MLFRSQARFGGMFDGPESGYPVMLHGKEMVLPDFKSRDLLNATNEATKQPLPQNIVNTSTTTQTMSNASDLLSDIKDMLEEKFDDLIDAVESGNSTQTKILRNSRA